MNDKTMNELPSGIYVKGVVISSSAQAYEKKDKSGVCVRVCNEIALQPGVIKWEKYHDPKEGGVEVVDGKVTRFPALQEFQTVLLKANKLKEFSGQVTVTHAEIVG